VTRGANRHVIREVLEDLEIRLEAYLTEWRGQLGIQEEAEADMARKEQPPAPTEPEQEKKGVQSAHLK
jgi:hypothetical protein